MVIIYFQGVAVVKLFLRYVPGQRLLGMHLPLLYTSRPTHRHAKRHREHLGIGDLHVGWQSPPHQATRCPAGQDS